MLRKIINSLSLIYETAKKERKLIFKDDATVEIYIIFVALIYFFYSFVYSPETFSKLPVAYVDNDQTTISHQIRRMLNDTESMSIAYDASSMEEAKKLFEEGKVNGIVVIPEQFSQKLQKSGGGPSIAIYCDASYMLYYDKSLQAVTEALGAFTGELQLKQTMMSGVPMKEAIASSKPFNIIATPLYNLEEGYGIFIIPMVLIVALQTLQLTGMGVLFGTLREQNTFITHFAMARRSRFGYFFMTIGRSIPYLVISMLLLLLGILVVFHIFTIPQRGNLAEVIVFLIPVVLAITFLGMTLMSIFRNREDTIMLLTVFSIPALMMGGVSYPVVAFPTWIKIMAFFFPSTIGVKGFLALSQAGASLNEIKDIYLQMWGLCLFYFVLAVWTNRRFLYWKNDVASNPQLNDANAVAALPSDNNSLIEAPEEYIEDDENLLEDVPTEYITAQDNEEAISSEAVESTDEPQIQIEAPTAIVPIVNEEPEIVINHNSVLTPISIAPSKDNSEPEIIIKESNDTIQTKIAELLEPFAVFVRHFDACKADIIKGLSAKLADVSPNNIQAPPAYLAVPALKAIGYNMDTPILSNLYFNLLANAMNKAKVSVVHPSFVETIKQLSPDEAQLLSGFAKTANVPYVDVIQVAERASSAMNIVLEKHIHLVEDNDLELDYIDNTSFYLSNLSRLGIIVQKEEELADAKVYQKLENCCLVRSIRKDIEQKGFEFETERGYYKTTIYGSAFIKAVVNNS